MPRELKDLFKACAETPGEIDEVYIVGETPEQAMVTYANLCMKIRELEYGPRAILRDITA
jgi:hypothetical protein